jgi:hypothetical protein
MSSFESANPKQKLPHVLAVSSEARKVFSNLDH